MGKLPCVQQPDDVEEVLLSCAPDSPAPIAAGQRCPSLPKCVAVAVACKLGGLRRVLFRGGGGYPKGVAIQTLTVTGPPKVVVSESMVFTSPRSGGG